VREAYRLLVAQGWTDALRQLHPGERICTFWKYFRSAFARDAGLRIDPPRAKRLISAGVDRDVRGREHASDHAPAWIELAGNSHGRKTCFIPKGARSLTEMTMDEQQAYSSNITAEAVGERLGNPPPDTREQTPRPAAASAGPRARVADKTAESPGERSGDAYADATMDKAREQSRRVFPHAATEIGAQTGGAALYPNRSANRPLSRSSQPSVMLLHC
jgi:hypothetical protein